jgi:two-component system osmolarity sensor histidine kinase EnvZ
VDNARQYASRIAISAARVGNTIEILVDDDGPGIPPEKREVVFQPYRRLDETRPRSASGLGLGLAIARDVVRSHGGEIVLDTAPMGGLRAQLTLPV